VSIGGNAVWDYLCDGPGRPKECLGSRAVSRLTEIDIYQVPVPIAA